MHPVGTWRSAGIGARRQSGASRIGSRTRGSTGLLKWSGARCSTSLHLIWSGARRSTNHRLTWSGARRPPVTIQSGRGPVAPLIIPDLVGGPPGPSLHLDTIPPGRGLIAPPGRVELGWELLVPSTRQCGRGHAASPINGC